eukprot:TRINITY_DN14117_c0_g1_i1.p1 TRINITY_DN14117_c0_g1~~TRINITY_DN14117_c0_g1_i1.p1  ORF type:complete len:689 (+),score=116.42 TRINITY_DN14117_c0_g1_i1:238-2067(+)
MALLCAVAEDGASKVSQLAKAMGATDIYVHDDPTDLHRRQLADLKEHCKEGGEGAPQVRTWRCPLRREAGFLGSATSFDVYKSATSSFQIMEPLPAPPSIAAVSTESSSVAQLLMETKRAPPSLGFADAVPEMEELNRVLAASSEPIASRAALIDDFAHSHNLTNDCTDGAELLQQVETLLEKGDGATASDIWGRPEGDVDSAFSKEEWAFRRVAQKDGYSGLIPGEIFSRVFSESLLWLGSISLRTMLKRLRSSPRSCDTEIEAVEANEWHRLLAMHDLSAKEQGLVEIKYWRWRGYLIRYLATASTDESATSKPALLGVHGFAASCTQFADLAKALGPGVRLFALDMLGFGHAEKPPLSYSQYTWEQCVKCFCLEMVGSNVVVMGNSIGGYIAQAAAASLGPKICPGLVLFNSAGPLMTAADYQESIDKAASGTMLERMERGFGDDAGLPNYSPPPQWLVDALSGFLFNLLQPNIEPVLKSLYPSNEAPLRSLAEDILRDSKDPFAVNVIASFSRLGPSRSSNELFFEYIGAGEEAGEAKLLVCQGMSDKLGGGPDNQPIRLRNFTSACPDLPSKAVPLQDCGHCPHHEAPEAVAAAVKEWLNEKFV